MAYLLCWRAAARYVPATLRPSSNVVRTRPAVRLAHTLPFEVDTNVAKDVVLFRYENPRLFRIVTFFGVGQYFFWMYLAQFARSSLRDVPVKPTEAASASWWRKVNLGENKYRVGLTFLFLTIGNVILGGSLLFTMRSLRHLVLLKGGKKVQIATYMPLVRHRILCVPLEHVSCSYSRREMVSHLPMKIKGYRLYFILDKRGTFTNTKLFDYTAGMRRNLK